MSLNFSFNGVVNESKVIKSLPDGSSILAVSMSVNDKDNNEETFLGTYHDETGLADRFLLKGLHLSCSGRSDSVGLGGSKQSMPAIEQLCDPSGKDIKDVINDVSRGFSDGASSDGADTKQVYGIVVSVSDEPIKVDDKSVVCGVFACQSLDDISGDTNYVSFACDDNRALYLKPGMSAVFDIDSSFENCTFSHVDSCALRGMRKLIRKELSGEQLAARKSLAFAGKVREIPFEGATLISEDEFLSDLDK